MGFPSDFQNQERSFFKKTYSQRSDVRQHGKKHHFRRFPKTWQVPKTCAHVDSKILMPNKTWSNQVGKWVPISLGKRCIFFPPKKKRKGFQVWTFNLTSNSKSSNVSFNGSFRWCISLLQPSSCSLILIFWVCRMKMHCWTLPSLRKTNYGGGVNDFTYIYIYCIDIDWDEIPLAYKVWLSVIYMPSVILKA